ncbi:endonuclease domain-containing protein [Frondihabitans cladoniiphilus]|uniref:endonuclease domain-containing protein n=1 Tax=Frondihabitans cladoniiphilus TaxID=715785 RepID=UPI0031EF98A6
MEFDLQYPVPGVGRVDLKVVGAPLLIEFDGYRFHSSPARFADDRRRSAEAQARGFTTLRFTAVQVREDWDWVESTVFATLSRIHR